MAAAGYTSTLKASGASTAMSGEACGSVSAALFQITNSAKRIVDPAVAVVVYDGVTVLVEGTDFILDRLFGRIALATAPAGAVTIDGNYLAVAAVAEVRKVSLSAARTQLDKSTFDNSNGWRTFLPALMSFTGAAELLAQPVADLDAGTGGTQSFFSFLSSGTAKLIEVTRASKMWRGWVQVEKIGNESEREGLVMCTIDFNGAAQARGACLMFEEVTPVFGVIPS